VGEDEEGGSGAGAEAAVSDFGVAGGGDIEGFGGLMGRHFGVWSGVSGVVFRML